jgi:crotonobetainyl-CoA:carnitine CoA-transferase CaiB-like acyl-CoA transferase
MKIEIGSTAHGPLVGYRVLDLSTVVSGPLCAQILGDLGADVLKVEAPGGDSARSMGLPMTDGISPLFAQCNRNKRSIGIDLKAATGQEVARKIAAGVDVVLSNYRPGVAERLGLGYDDLIAVNSELVYVAISGFGPDGPYRDLPAYDTVIQGLSGFMPLQGGDAEPQLVRSIIADKVTALTAVYAVMGGLLARERGGRSGQRVDVPMLDAYAAFMLPDILAGTLTFPESTPPVFPNIHRTWKTADGHVVMMIIENYQFAGICRAIDREDLVDDPRCIDLIQRLIHAEEIFAIIEEELLKWTTADFLSRAQANGAPVANANSIDDFLADPQVAHNGTIVETDIDPALGTTRYVGPGVRFAQTPATFRRLPPRLGEQTDEILTEAGYDGEQIEKLRGDGAVC